jgi:hypothetical protein
MTRKVVCEHPRKRFTYAPKLAVIELKKTVSQNISAKIILKCYNIGPRSSTKSGGS